MAEKLTLSTPIINSQPNTTDWEVAQFNIDRENSIIAILLKDNRGIYIKHRYEGLIAATLIKQLNVARLDLKSLEKRILERLNLDGILVGNVTGSPD